ncbi:hypothetical protein HPB52_016288 [Rhipicephalus sanguineus]|uniref:Sugar transporter SWEET1 n=1 Tax=Rhipicephalus sanguineus TaxID=34632 RepID=A0A9D4Q770_RHISA|nr:hypothetical protein HPB52_016288 [Rhipicephalus sanguineus]
MEATRDWIGDIASALTIASFVGSLSISWRVWRARSSAGVAFLPLAVVITCMQIWLFYGRATGETRVTLVSACGLVLTTVNATVHCIFAPDFGSELQLVVALMLMCVVPSVMGVAQLGGMAFSWSVAYNLVPIRAIPSFPRMKTGLWRITIFGLWTVYGWLAGDQPLYASNLIGFIAGIGEIASCFRMLLPDSFRPELQ